MKFLAFFLWFFVLSAHAQPSGDPLNQILAKYEMPPAAIPATAESLRERVCRAMSALRDVKALAKIGSDWVQQDFAEQSPVERKELFTKLVDSLSKGSIHFQWHYAKLLSESRQLKSLSCVKLQEWAQSHLVGKGQTPMLSAKCTQPERLDWLTNVVTSSDFIYARLRPYSAEALGDPRFKMLFENSVAIGDFLAALAIRWSSDKALLPVPVISEPFGLPPGPYACSGSIGGQEVAPLITTTFYYWYDFGSNPVKSSLSNPSKWEKAFSLMPTSTAGMHFENEDWYRREFFQIADAGINAVLAVYRGGPYGRYSYADQGLIKMVRSLWSRPPSSHPLIGLLLDGAIFSQRGNGRSEWVNLASPRGGIWMAAVARNFYSLVPAAYRASVKRQWVVGLKNLTQARSVSLIGMDKFLVTYQKIFGNKPHTLFPRNEMVNYVDSGVTASVMSATERLANGVPTLDALVNMIASENLSKRISTSNLALAKQIHQHWCLYGYASGDFESEKQKVWAPYWAPLLTSSKDALVRRAFESCYENLIERNRARILGVMPRISLEHPTKNEKLLAKDLLSYFADFYADERFHSSKGSQSQLIHSLNIAIEGKCPTKEEFDKLDSMLKTWDRRLAVTYFLSGRRALQRLVSSWHVDYLMNSYRTAENEISWEGHACGVAPGIPTVIAGRDDHAIARLNGTKPSVIERNLGTVYSNLWTSILKRNQTPSLVHIESWNGYHDGTAIGPTLEYGAHYRDLTQTFSKQYVGYFQSGMSAKGIDRQVSSAKRRK